MVPIVLLLGGCASVHAPTAVHGVPINGVNYIDFPSERRGAWVIDEAIARNVRVCAEPFTDTGVTTQQLMQLAGKLKDDKGSASATRSTMKQLMELKGRTPAVLALRDVMYRMCERGLSLADGVIPERELHIYERIVSTIDQFAEADRLDAEAAKANAVVEAAAVEVRATAGEMTVAERHKAAREAQDRGFELLAQCKWTEAESSFRTADTISPMFQASYEFARALRVNRGNEAAGVLELNSAYMPTGIVERIRKCDVTAR